MKTVTLLISLTALALPLFCAAQSSSLTPTTSLSRCLFRSRSCPIISNTCHPDDIIDEVVERSYWYIWGSSQSSRCLTGCKVCVSELPNCVVPCLLLLPSCTNGQRLTNQVLFRNGRQCQGCQICQKKATCPERECEPAPPKQGCRNLQTIGTTNLPDGTVCEGCPSCDPEDVICIALPCPNPGNCNQPITNTFEFFGKTCPGCLSPCPIDLICRTPQICPACVPPPGYISPPPGEDGCVPCPPCGNGSITA